MHAIWIDNVSSYLIRFALLQNAFGTTIEFDFWITRLELFHLTRVWVRFVEIWGWRKIDADDGNEEGEEKADDAVHDESVGNGCEGGDWGQCYRSIDGVQPQGRDKLTPAAV